MAKNFQKLGRIEKILLNYLRDDNNHNAVELEAVVGYIHKEIDEDMPRRNITRALKTLEDKNLITFSADLLCVEALRRSHDDMSFDLLLKNKTLKDDRPLNEVEFELYEYLRDRYANSIFNQVSDEMGPDGLDRLLKIILSTKDVDKLSQLFFNYVADRKCSSKLAHDLIHYLGLSNSKMMKMLDDVIRKAKQYQDDQDAKKAAKKRERIPVDEEETHLKSAIV